MMAVAERLQKKYSTFSSLLAGGAFAVFYLLEIIVIIGVIIFAKIKTFLYL